MAEEKFVPVGYWFDCDQRTNEGIASDLLAELSTVAPEEAQRLEDSFDWDEVETEYVDGLIDEIVDALNEYTLPYTYCGFDSGGFGCWVALDTLTEEVAWGEIATLDDSGNVVFAPRHTLTLKMGQPLPDYAYVVNDHGNAALYRVKIELEEVWSTV